MPQLRLLVSRNAGRLGGRALVLGLLFLSVRLPVALSSPRVVEPEELYIGTIGREILLGDYPCGLFELQYGHHDFGSLVNGVLAAGLFSLLGSSALVLQILALVFALIAYLASIGIARHLGGVKAGRVAALLLLLPPPLLVRASLSAQGNHGEAIAFAAVALLATLGLLRIGDMGAAGAPARPPVWARLALIGVVLGAGVSYYFGFLLAAAAVLALLLGARPSPILGRKGLCLLVGFALGTAPWVYSAVAVGQASLDRPLSATRAALGMARSSDSAHIKPWTDVLEDTGHHLLELLGRDLPEAFTARWPASSPVGENLTRAGNWREDKLTAVFPEAGDKPRAERQTDLLQSRTPAGLTWYLLCALGIVGLAVTAIPARLPPARIPNPPGRAMTIAALVPLGFLTIFALGYALSPLGVTAKTLALYPGDEYLPYRYLAPAVWMLVLGAGVAIGKALDARHLLPKAIGIGACILATFLGTMSFLAYLDDPLFAWDPARNARQEGSNYAPLGIKLARDAEHERPPSLERFSAGGRLDPGSWPSFQRLKTWTERRGEEETRMMVAHYLTDLLAQPDQPAPEKADAYLAELHGLCGELAEPARELFCRILLAGFPPPALAQRRPAPPRRLDPPLPRRPHPVCAHFGCCGASSIAPNSTDHRAKEIQGPDSILSLPSRSDQRTLPLPRSRATAFRALRAPTAELSSSWPRVPPSLFLR